MKMKLIENPTKDEEKLEELRKHMNEVEMYSEEWLLLKSEYQKLWRKIEKNRE